MKKIIQKLVVLGLLLLIGSIATVNAQEVKDETDVGEYLTKTVFNAQDSKHEIRVGVGAMSMINQADIIVAILEAYISIGSIFMGDDNEASSRRNVGNLWHINPYISYKYKINKRFSVGSTFGYSNVSDTYYGKYDNQKDESPVIGNQVTHRLTFLVDGYVNYFQNGIITLYGTLGVGFYLESPEYIDLSPYENKYHNDIHSTFSFQVSPIGIQIGKRVSGFVELGFGFRGIINGGIAYRF